MLLPAISASQSGSLPYAEDAMRAQEYAWQYFHALKRDLRLGRDKQFEDRSDVLPREVLPGARS